MAKTLAFRPPPSDHAQRAAAVEVGSSVIVQAPAGSGKTSLLIERFLRLLATVEDPRRVLAITFTRSAAADMRARAMQALAFAAGRVQHAEKMTDNIVQAAEAAMHASAKNGWNLLEQPEQLNILTIDSLALSIAQQTPLTTWLGPDLQPVDNAQQFYKLAALRTLQFLEQAGSTEPSLDPRDRETAEAVALLLRHRDNNWQNCAKLLARMLETRDQWGRLFPLRSDELSEAWLDGELRPALEHHLRRMIEEHLRGLPAVLRKRDTLCRRLLAIAAFSAANSPGEESQYSGLSEFPGSELEDHPCWEWLAGMCLAADGKNPRKQFDRRSGFLPKIAAREIAEAKSVAVDVHADEELRGALHSVRELPPAQLTDEQWQVAKALFRLLRRALGELQSAFAQAGLVDFTEIGLAARIALDSDGLDGNPSELALKLGDQYQHLLVDEFQDTSRSQVALVERLIANWEPGEGRTIFLVGDPQQSIYMFRQAEVKLFTQVAARGIGELKPERKTLTVNFRSARGLVEAHNHMLAPIFSAGSDVEFVPSVAHIAGPDTPPLHWHFSVKPPRDATPEDKTHAERQDAEQVCNLAKRALAASPTTSVAILVRAKAHALRIMRRLHERNIGFRAIDMEPLEERQEVLDVFSLTRAILNPADRVAWLALLRAPWCGLQLTSLDALAGNPNIETIAASITAGVERLSREDQLRTRRVLEAVRAAQTQLRDSRLPFAVWTAWRAIGGDACVNAEQYENVRAYFAMLERMDEEAIPLRCDTIESEMERLCAAPNPDPTLRLEIMTIHKAKGLEWDVVILPQLHRWIRAGERPAVEWMEDQIGDQSAWFLAPMEEHGGEKSDLYEWIRRRRRQRETYEAARLFYVAATRARSELHLLGAAEVRDGKVIKPALRSLLHTTWPAAQTIAEQQLLGAEEMPGEVERIAAGEAAPARNRLYRLTQAWHVAHPAPPAAAAGPEAARTKLSQDEFLTRASFERRAEGRVLHSLLEQAARRRAAGDDWPTLQAWARGATPQIERLLFVEGLPSSRISRGAVNIHKLLQIALASEKGRWLVEARDGALTEFALTTTSADSFTGFRLDRVFPAGEALLSEGNSHLWLVDYKSAALAGKQLDTFLATQTAAYAATMAQYAQALRAMLNDPRPIRCALYFPALDLIHELTVLN